MFEFLFRYPMATWSEAARVFDTDWPIEWLWAVLLGSFLIVFGWLLFSRRSLSAGRTLSIACLQWLVIAGLAVLLWQPSLLNEQLLEEENTVAFLLDTSASMDYLDADVARIDRAQALLEDGPIKTVRDTYGAGLWAFSSDAQAMETLADLPPPGSETHLGASVLTVLEQARSDSLAALVVLSDGSDSSGNISEQLLDEISSFNIPVHTVGIGRTSIAEDLEIERLDLPATVLPSSTVAASVSIRHDAPGLARLKVYDGDRYLASSEIELAADSQNTVASIEFQLADDGYRNIDFRLDRLEQELNVENNRFSQLVEVVERRYRVLYAEGEPRWEHKFIRRAFNDDPVVDITSLLWVSDNKFFRQGVENEQELSDGFPTSKDELYGYDAILIGSVEAPRFTSEQQQMIHDFVSQRGGALMMLGGRKGLAAGGWDHSLVGDSLPVELNGEEELFIREKARAVLTSAGSVAVSLKFADDPQENVRRWSELPELANYQNIGALKPAASTLMSAQTSLDAEAQTVPLLVSQPYGLGKTMVLATSGTWRWQMLMPAEDQRHETFWRQTMRALVSGTPTKFDLHAEQMGGQVHVRAELRGDDYNPLTDVRLTALLESSAGGVGDLGADNRLELQPAYGEPGVYTASLEGLSPGVVYMDTIASRDGEPIDSARTAVQVVDDRSEFFNIRQDQAQLTVLAEATGGRYWQANDLSELPATIAESRSGITQATLLPIWDLPIWFFLLVALKAGEWFLRRYWGYI